MATERGRYSSAYNYYVCILPLLFSYVLYVEHLSAGNWAVFLQLPLFCWLPVDKCGEEVGKLIAKDLLLLKAFPEDHKIENGNLIIKILLLIS